MSTDTLTNPVDTQSIPQGRWRIDPTRSSVEFRTPTLWGLATVRGRFETYEGTLDLQQDPAIELTIEAASLNTNLGFRDKPMRRARASRSSSTRACGASATRSKSTPRQAPITASSA